MAYIAKSDIKPTGNYTQADASTFARVGATVDLLGVEGIFKDYAHKSAEAFIGRLPFVEIIKNNKWLEQAHTMEPGENAGKITDPEQPDNEYVNPDFGQAQLGFDTTVKPLQYTGGYTFSKAEQVRLASETDEVFKALAAEKLLIPVRDFNNKIKKSFIDNVLNKVDDATGNYLSPDGQPLISDAHTNKNGENAWTNKIVPAGATGEEKVDDFVKSVRTYSATATDAGGNYLETEFDTFICSPIFSEFDALTQKFNISPKLDKVGRDEIATYFDKTTVYPETSKAITLYSNSDITIVTVKGMATDLLLAMDSTGDNLDSNETKPVKFKILKDLAAEAPIKNENGSINVSFFAFFNFWTKGRGRNILGGRF